MTYNIPNTSATGLDDPYNASGLGAPAIIRGTVYAHKVTGVTVGSGQTVATQQATATALQSAMNYASANNKFFEIVPNIYQVYASGGLLVPAGAPFVWRGSRAGTIIQQSYSGGTGAPVLTFGSGSVASTGFDIDGLTVIYSTSQTGLTKANAIVINNVGSSNFNNFNIGSSASGSPAYNNISFSQGTVGACSFNDWQTYQAQQNQLTVATVGDRNVFSNISLINGASGTYNALGGNFVYWNAGVVNETTFIELSCLWGACNQVISLDMNIGFHVAGLHVHGIKMTGTAPCIVASTYSDIQIDTMNLIDIIAQSANLSSTPSVFSDNQTSSSSIQVNNFNWVNNTGGQINKNISLFYPQGGNAGDDVTVITANKGFLRDVTSNVLDTYFQFDANMPNTAGQFNTPNTFGKYDYSPSISTVDRAVIAVTGAYTHYGAYTNATLLVPASITSFTLKLADTIGATGNQLPYQGNTCHVRRQSGTAAGTLTVQDGGGTTLWSSTTAAADQFFLFSGSAWGTFLSPTSSGTGESAPGTNVPVNATSISASITPGVAQASGPYNVLTISNSVILLNGQSLGASGGANVTNLYYINHEAFQENTAGNWYGPMSGTINGWYLGAQQTYSPIPSITSVTPTTATIATNLAANSSVSGITVAFNPPTTAFTGTITIGSANVAGESANGTYITTSGLSNYINASPTVGYPGSGYLFSISSGAQIIQTVNGVSGVFGGTAVTGLYYIGHSIYQVNSSNNWYGPMSGTVATAFLGSPLTGYTPVVANTSLFATGGTSAAPTLITLNATGTGTGDIIPGTYTISLTATPTVAYSGVTVPAYSGLVTVTVGAAGRLSPPAQAVSAGYTNPVIVDDFTSSGTVQLASGAGIYTLYNGGNLNYNPTNSTSPGNNSYWVVTGGTGVVYLEPDTSGYGFGLCTAQNLNSYNNISQPGAIVTGAVGGLVFVQGYWETSIAVPTTGQWAWWATTNLIATEGGTPIPHYELDFVEQASGGPPEAGFIDWYGGTGTEIKTYSTEWPPTVAPSNNNSATVAYWNSLVTGGAFNTYGCLWTPSAITMYYNNQAAIPPTPITGTTELVYLAGPGNFATGTGGTGSYADAATNALYIIYGCSTSVMAIDYLCVWQ